MTTDDFSWATSSYSANTKGRCVEIGRPQTGVDAMALRDSTNRAAGHLTLTTHEWSAFLNAVRAQEYDG